MTDQRGAGHDLTAFQGHRIKAEQPVFTRLTHPVRVAMMPASRERAHTFGWVAEWSCSGLQLRVRRFDSDLSLQISATCL